jgi:hypothetical protein
MPTAGAPAAKHKPMPWRKSADKDVEFRQVSEAVISECIVNMARIKEATPTLKSG